MLSGLKQQLQRTRAALPARLGGREPQPVAVKGRPAAKAVPQEGRITRFIRETRSELKKVTWPTREQTTNLTAVVIGVSAAVGLLMGGVDFLFQKIFQLLLGVR